MFVAVELTEEARGELAALQEDLRKSGADVKWVEPGNLHLTLKFLGEIDEDRLPALTQALQDTAGRSSPVAISLEGVGAFPRPQHPRVIWVGIKEGSEALTALAGSIEEGCARLGLPPEERSFSAHLTLGRVRSGERLSGLVKKLQEISFRASAPAAIDRVILFQSVLSSNGPTYIRLKTIPFGPRKSA